jgi:hypothetical protein
VQTTWEYPAKLDKVISGSVLVVILDMGLQTYRHERVELMHVKAPPVETPDGKRAISFTTQWMDLVPDPTIMHRHTHRIALQPDPEWPFIVRTVIRQSTGIWLVDIWRLTDGKSLAQHLLESKLVVSTEEVA